MSGYHRPPRMSRIYSDNHKFGVSLYSGALEDIEKRYRSAIKSATLRADRPDLTSQTIYQLSSIGSAQPSCDRLAGRSGGGSGRRERPASMFVESTTHSAAASGGAAGGSLFEKELRQLNSRSAWDLRESRLELDKGTAHRHYARVAAPRRLYTDCRYMDSIFVGPRGFKVFFY